MNFCWALIVSYCLPAAVCEDHQDILLHAVCLSLICNQGNFSAGQSDIVLATQMSEVAVVAASSASS